jgi:WD40 repeat protein
LEFKDSSLLLHEDHDLLTSYLELVRYYSKNHEYVNTLETCISRINSRISDDIKTKDRQLEHLAAIESYTVKKKMNTNHKRLVVSDHVISQIRSIMADIKNTLYEYSIRLKDDDELYKIDEIANNARKKGITKATKMVWTYSLHDKIPTFDDVYDIIEVDLEEEKYAKVYLNTSNRKGLGNEYIKNLTKSVTREGIQTQGTRHSTMEDEGYGRHKTFESLSEQQVVTDIMGERVGEDIVYSGGIKRLGDKSETFTRLAKEIEDLKSRNDVLNSQIHESSLISIEKLPIYVKYHVPFRGDGDSFAFKASVSISTQESIKCIQTIQEADLIALGDAKGYLTLFKLSTLKEIITIPISSKAIKDILYMNDGTTLFTASLDGCIAKLDLGTYKHIYLDGPLDTELRCLANPHNGHSIFAAGEKNITEWSFIRDKLICGVEGHRDTITDLIFVQPKDLLISASLDRDIKLWNPKALECIGLLEGHLQGVLSISYGFIKDHLNIVSIAKDNVITFWDMDDKDLTKSLRMNDLGKNVLYLHDKRNFITIHKDSRICLWDTVNSERKEIYIEDNFKLTTGCYSDDGHSIILCTEDGRILMYN